MSQVITALAPYKGYLALGAYLLITEILAKIPKVRANTLFEVLYNPVARALRAVPLVGKVADLFDSPPPVTASQAAQPASEPTPKSASGGFITIEMVIVLSLLGLGAGLLLGGCASGADGLRQACSATDRVLEGAYQATTSGYKVDQEHLRAQLAANTITGHQADETMIKHKNIADKILATLDGLKASKQAFCALIPAVEAGQRKDTPQIIASVTQIGAAIPALVASIQQLMSIGEKPPEPERLVFVDRRRCAHV